MSIKSTITFMVALMAWYAVAAYDFSRMYMHAEEETEFFDSVALEEGSELTSSFLEEMVSNARKGNPDIIISSQDHRVYQNLTLPNGLEVLLVSDPTTTKAAASVDIGVGYFQDPENVAGLAHFLEHMLFLGSAKYPAENAFESYIHTNGGGNNAYTSMEHTNFFFDILPNSLEGALDRFAQFFISPRLSIDHTAREMQAVNSEHRKNIESDGWRGTEIKRHVASKETPYFKFGTGSVETLGKHSPEVLREHLQKLWNDYYTAGNMRLVVYGKQDVDTLAEYVKKYFTEVRPTPAGSAANSRAVAYPSSHTVVYDRPLLGSVVYYEPVRRQRTIALQWSVPSQITKYINAAGKYLSVLMEAEGRGTVHSYLRQQGWITSFEAGVQVSAQTFSLFTVEAALTPRGMEHVDDIVSAIYQYIAFVREFGVEKWRFDEMAKIAQTNFEWKPLQRAQKYVSALSSSMRWVEPRHWVTARSLFYQWNEQEVRTLLEYLNPDNMVLFVSAKKIGQKTGVTLNQKEENYGIAFAAQRLQVDRLERFKHYSQTGQRDFLGVFSEQSSIQLPVANQWIASDAALAIKPYYDLKTGEYRVRVSSKDALHVAPPVILTETSAPSLRVWFKQDAKFKKPKVAVKMRFWTTIGENSPQHAAMSIMYTKLVRDSLRDWAYPALAAGYGYSFSVDEAGVVLSFTGYADGLSTFISEVVTKIYSEFKVDPARFETLRERALESLANSKFHAPYRYARTLSRHFLTDQQSIADLAPALSTVTIKEVQNWPDELFGDTRLECLFAGNIYPWQAKSMAQVVVDTLPYETVSERYTPTQRVFPNGLSRRPALDGRYSAYTLALDKHEPNSMVFHIYQAGPAGATPEDRLYLGLLDNLLRKPAYNVLRTQEQLGYIVWAFGVTTADVNEFVIQVQSSSYEPQYLDARVQTFLSTYREKLRKMLLEKPAVFANNVKTLYQNKLMNATTLAQEVNSIWSAIDTEKFNFMQRFEDAQRLVKTVTIEGLLDYFDRTFGFGNYSGKSLSIQIASHAHHPADKPRDVVNSKYPAHIALPAPAGRMVLTTTSAANVTIAGDAHPFAKKNVVEITEYVKKSAKELAEKRRAARLAALKKKQAAEAEKPVVAQPVATPIARVQAAIDAAKPVNVTVPVVAAPANGTLPVNATRVALATPLAALLTVDEEEIAMLELQMNVEAQVDAEAEIYANTEDVEGMVKAALSAASLLEVETATEMDTLPRVQMHAGTPAASLLEVEMLAVSRMDAASAAEAMQEIAVTITEQNKAEEHAQRVLASRVQAAKADSNSFIEVDADAEVNTEDAVEADAEMELDADEELQAEMELDAETEVEAEHTPSTTHSSVRTVKRLPRNRLEAVASAAASSRRASRRKAPRVAAKGTFRYDGKDTDVELALTISRGAEVSKKTLRVSGLAALRREMFMYPLQEARELPAVIALPANAPVTLVASLPDF